MTLPLNTVPYQMDAPFPKETSPMTAALGATKAPSPMLGSFPATPCIVLCMYTAWHEWSQPHVYATKAIPKLNETNAILVFFETERWLAQRYSTMKAFHRSRNSLPSSRYALLPCKRQPSLSRACPVSRIMAPNLRMMPAILPVLFAPQRGDLVACQQLQKLSPGTPQWFTRYNFTS